MAENIATQIIKKAKNIQPDIANHFMQVIAGDDLSHAYLFSGATGFGKLAVAKTIAMRLFCIDVQPDGFPCGKCNECVRIANNEHPDVLLLEPDGQSIKIEQVRMLKREFSKSAVEGNRKVFIIDHADLMTNSAANSLLKFIEEPAGNVNSFLLTNDYHKILPTIISRSQLTEFPQVSQVSLYKYAEKKDLPTTAINLALQLTSDISEIDRLCEDDWLINMKSVIEKWFNKLTKHDAMAFTMVQTDIMPLVRDRTDQQLTFDMLVLIFRDVFNLKYKHTSADKLAFGNIYDLLQQVGNQLSSEQLITIIDDILKQAQRQKINVSFQSIVEVITLDCLKIMK